MDLAAVVFRVAIFQAIAWLSLILILGSNASLHILAIGFSVLCLLSNLFTLSRGFKTLNLYRHEFMRELFTLHGFKKIKPLLKVGGGFFFLQLTSLVLFNLGTYLAYSVFSATVAAKYDILNKFYQIPMTLFNVVIVVAWSVIARFIAERSSEKLYAIQLQLLLVSLIGGVCLLIVSWLIVPSFVRIYTHGEVEVSYIEALWFGGQTAVQMVAYTGAVFMNAAERLRIQIVFAIIAALIFLPIFYIIESYGFQLSSIPITTLLVVLPAAFYFNCYVRKFIISPLT